MLESNVKEEETKNWEQLSERQQKMVAQAHAESFKTPKLETMLRVFNLGNPIIVIGKKDGSTYCRIHPESVDVMVLLTNSYL